MLCFRDGTLVGAAGLDCFGAPECIAEEAVDSWLRRHKGLLLAQPAAARSAGNRGGGAAGGSSSGSSSEEEGEDDWQQPCEVCGRRYPHQHFRSVYASRQSGSDSEPGE